jgi:hypothetical protein
MAVQKDIERVSAAVEMINRVVAPEFLDDEQSLPPAL